MDLYRSWGSSLLEQRSLVKFTYNDTERRWKDNPRILGDPDRSREKSETAERGREDNAQGCVEKVKRLRKGVSACIDFSLNFSRNTGSVSARIDEKRRRKSV